MIARDGIVHFLIFKLDGTCLIKCEVESKGVNWRGGAIYGSHKAWREVGPLTCLCLIGN